MQRADMHHKEVDVKIDEVVDREESQIVGDMIIDIKAMLQDSEEDPLSDECCIYRVPHEIREQNEGAYTPKVVSIGPFHYCNSRLKNMEERKKLLFKKFIEEAKPNLDDLVNFVNKLEPRVRACYSEKIELSKKELVKVILVDAIFIIQFFLKSHEAGDWSLGDRRASKPMLINQLVEDLLLLENQLPFFILEELYNQFFYRVDLPSFLQLSFEFFHCYNRQNTKPNPNVKINHFTDILRTFHLREKTPQVERLLVKNQLLVHSASELHEAGLKLKVKKSECLLDLKFSGGVLEIPHALVHDRTETFFRNMIALELCHYPSETYIVDYAGIMDALINTSKDVDLLIQKDIINNCMADSNDVAKLYNGLCIGIVWGNCDSDYIDTCNRLNAFYKNPWNQMKATLRRDYCNTPWQVAASVAGILLLILSIVQTICSLIPLLKV